MSKVRIVLPPLKRGRPDGGKLTTDRCIAGCGRKRYKCGDTVYSMCKQCRAEHYRQAATTVKSGTCCETGCDEPRYEQGKTVYTRCWAHCMERRREVYHTRRRQESAERDRLAREDAEREQRMVADPTIQLRPNAPYAWRNRRPGSMSEALRIDTRGTE